MSDIDKSLGQVAFEAYRVAVSGQTFDGKPIPGWDELHGDRLKVQGGWEAAAQAIRQHLRMIDAIDRATHRRQPSQWVRLPDPLLLIPAEPEPEFSAPIGRGEPPTGEAVPVDVEPDDVDEVPDCDEPHCTRRAADH